MVIFSPSCLLRVALLLVGVHPCNKSEINKRKTNTSLITWISQVSKSKSPRGGFESELNAVMPIWGWLILVSYISFQILFIFFFLSSEFPGLYPVFEYFLQGKD
jgi:hypothetical protein